MILIPHYCPKAQLHLSILQNRKPRNCAFQEKSDEFLLLGNCRSHIFWKNLRTSCTSEKSTSLGEEEGNWQQIPKTLSWEDLLGLVEAKVLYVCMLLSLSPQRDCLHQFLGSSW